MIPLLLAIVIKRTPQWAPWATIVVGLFVSYFIANIFTAEDFVSIFGIESLTRREIIDMNIILTIAGHVFITAGFFWATTLFYKEENDKNKVATDSFFKDLETPVIADDLQDEVDRQQRIKLGNMVMVMSLGILLMALIPNPFWGRIMFATCALIIACLGFLLKRSAVSKNM